jgi:hypothetical protein
MAKGNNSAIISFRIDSDHLNSLKKEASRREISLNTLASQIFCSFVEWDMHAVEAGWLVLTKDVVKQLFDQADDKKIASMAKTAAKEVEYIFLLMRGTCSVDVFCSVLRNIARKSGFPMVEEEDPATHSRKFIIQHDMGKKWSLFYKIYYEEILNELKCKAAVEVTSNSIVVEIWNGC